MAASTAHPAALQVEKLGGLGDEALPEACTRLWGLAGFHNDGHRFPPPHRLRSQAGRTRAAALRRDSAAETSHRGAAGGMGAPPAAGGAARSAGAASLLKTAAGCLKFKTCRGQRQAGQQYI